MHTCNEQLAIIFMTFKMAGCAKKKKSKRVNKYHFIYYIKFQKNERKRFFFNLFYFLFTQNQIESKKGKSYHISVVVSFSMKKKGTEYRNTEIYITMQSILMASNTATSREIKLSLWNILLSFVCFFQHYFITNIVRYLQHRVREE